MSEVIPVELIEKIAESMWGAFLLSPNVPNYARGVRWDNIKDSTSQRLQDIKTQYMIQAVYAYKVMKEHPHTSADSEASQD